MSAITGPKLWSLVFHTHTQTHKNTSELEKKDRVEEVKNETH